MCVFRDTYNAYTYMTHFAVHLKLTKRCKSTLLQIFKVNF